MTAMSESPAWGRFESTSVLDTPSSPADLRLIPRERLPETAQALRRGIIDAVSRTGGHLGASLGVVELTTALHYVFDTPRDKLVFDVGHQGYPHKFLTGRRLGFPGLGKSGGIGKFLRRGESPYDVFGAGHAGTSISAAVGIAEAIRRRGGDESVVAVIGDGSVTAGMAYEALNHAGAMRLDNLIVVLNHNGMSISPNVGALSEALDGRASRSLTRRVRRALAKFMEPGNAAGADHLESLRRTDDQVRSLISPAGFFEALGFSYVGPVDGHDTQALVETFERIRGDDAIGGPVLVHCRTEKGRGYAPARDDFYRYHGVTPFDVASGEMQKKAPGPPSWTSVFADALTSLADADDRIVGITAAMADGTGLGRFAESHPDRLYDVGIAEQHAVTMAAGMATEQLKPVCAIYSTFLQRAFDQVVHDVCVQNLDVTFALDRGGLVGADGATHQGLYDYAYLRALPNMVVMAPRDENELRRMLRTAIEHPGPAAVRFPRGPAMGVDLDPSIEPLALGDGELLRDGRDVALVAIGTGVAAALRAAEALERAGIGAAVLDARFVKPLDERRIVEIAGKTRVLLTIEEHVADGGFGEAVVSLLARRDAMPARTRVLALPDRVIEHGDRAEILSEHGLDAHGIARLATDMLAECTTSPPRPGQG